MLRSSSLGHQTAFLLALPIAGLLCLTSATGAGAESAASDPSPPSGDSESPSPSAEIVALEFDWPVGMKARAVSRIRRSRLRAGVTDSTSIVSTYQMQCSRHPEGLLIEYRSFALVDEDELPTQPQPERLAQLASSMMPSLIVAEDGELLRIEGVERIREGLEPLLEPVREDDPQIAAALGELLARALSEDALEERVAEEWSALVGFWAEADLEIGATYEMESESAHPLFPGTMLPFRFRFWAEGRKPCHEDDPEANCIELRMMSFPDPDVLQGILDQLLSAPGAAAYEELHIENSVRLLTEPGSLLPHRIDVLRTTWGMIRPSGERAAPFEQMQLRSTAYFYEE